MNQKTAGDSFSMINIPTELLRTLIAVVDLRSFTKAAQQLGVTQPAVSAQLKRLQLLLGCDVLDKSAPGVTLTAMGELVVNYARRMLSINDQILDLAAPRHNIQTIRIAVPNDIVAPALPATLLRFNQQWPGIRFAVKSGPADSMIRELRQGELELLITMGHSGPVVDARHQWMEPMAWVRGPHTNLDVTAPIPLVSYGDLCAGHRLALMALSQAGLDHDLVFIAPSFVSLSAAVRAGMGVMPYPRSRSLPEDLSVWDDGPLPPINDVSCAIYLRDGGEQAVLEQVADTLADVLKPAAPSRQPERSSPLTAAAYLIG
jgi:DNA-binding transcriptional LysR family regulator